MQTNNLLSLIDILKENNFTEIVTLNGYTGFVSVHNSKAQKAYAYPSGEDEAAQIEELMRSVGAEIPTKNNTPVVFSWENYRCVVSLCQTANAKKYNFIARKYLNPVEQ